MQQASLFDVPVSSSEAREIPVRGTTQAAKQASQSGARMVVKTWPERQSVVLQLLAGGAKCRQELAGLTPYGINGICSVIGALLKKGAIERTGDHDLEQWGDGSITKRERFRVKR